MDNRLQAFMNAKIPLIDQALSEAIEREDFPQALKDSMHYSIQAGGKRIRPLLIFATLHDLGADSQDATAVACAVEFIHTYSLIHDDLPCMDDDDYRRGKPTNHKVYGEAVAVLAGDALLTLAFKLVSDLRETKPESTLQIVRILAEAAGGVGMVGGQILDLEGEQTSLQLNELENVHRRKTGALLHFSIEAGGILAKATQQQLDHLSTFARHIGLAFQIQDDILDVTSTTEQLGKTANSDAANEKSTYPAILGLEGAQKHLADHHNRAIEALTFIENKPSMLQLLADYIVQRNV